jgi:SpoU rRNA methylase family enzyme
MTDNQRKLVAGGLVMVVFFLLMGSVVMMKSSCCAATTGYAKEMILHFDGGQTVIQLQDREAVLELSERQPLMLQARREAGKVVLLEVAENIFERVDGQEMVPAKGDFIMDLSRKEMAIYDHDETVPTVMIPLGHVTADAAALFREQGSYDIFMTAKP